MKRKYTQIENDVFEAIISIKLSNSERQIVLAYLRKLNGFHKDKDQISISQIMEMTGLSNRTVINGQRQLQRMNICSLVKKGVSRKHSSIWAFNKNVSTWRPVKRVSLVKFPTTTSEKSRKQPMNISSHTKESIQENTKERVPPKKNSSVSVLKDAIVLKGLKGKFPAVNVDGEVEKMLDYLKSSGKTYKDYQAFARNWCRKAVEMSPDGGVKPRIKYGTHTEGLQATADSLKKQGYEIDV